MPSFLAGVDDPMGQSTERQADLPTMRAVWGEAMSATRTAVALGGIAGRQCEHTTTADGRPDAFVHCALKKGHRGTHVTYPDTIRQWFTRDEWEARLAAWRAELYRSARRSK